MAVDLMGYSKMDDQIAIQEAAAAGLRSLEHLLFQLSHHQNHQQVDCREITDLTVSKFRKMISVLDRTGHARFRRGHQLVPSPSPPPPMPALTPLAPQTLTLDFTKPSSTPCPLGGGVAAGLYRKDGCRISPPISSENSSFLSSITGDGSVTNGNQGSSLLLPPVAAAAASAGKPPLSSSFKKKCSVHAHSGAASGGSCHCSKSSKTLPYDLTCAVGTQEITVDEDDKGAGDKLEDGGHPGGRALVEEVRAEADQGIPLPQGVLQVQHREGVPGEEARGAGARGPIDAHRYVRGGAPACPAPDDHRSGKTMMITRSRASVQ